MTNESWDVAVVGAGPAGATAALRSAQRGRRTLLIDKAAFPRPKVCGGCLNRLGLSVLNACGLGDLPRRLGCPRVDSLHFFHRRGRAVVPLPPGVAVRRDTFDAALVEAALAAGVTFRPDVRVTGTAVQPDSRVLHTDTGDMRAGVVLLATGLASKLGGIPRRLITSPEPSSRVGLGGTLIGDGAVTAGAVAMHVGRGGYVGFARLGGGLVDVAAALDRDFLRDGPRSAIRRVMKEAGSDVPAGLDAVTWKGTPPLTHTPRSVASDRLLLVGDAAGYTEPFTGEGMGWAMLSGYLAADCLGRAAAWPAVHRRRVAGRRAVSRLLCAALRRPAAASLVARALAACPGAAAPFARFINRPLEGSR